MKVLSIGSKFNFEHVDYEVLERHENYLLLQGRQYGQNLWTTANVLTTDDANEVCRPFFNDVSPESKIFNKLQVKAFYDSEVKRMETAARSKKERETNERQAAEELQAKNNKFAELKSLQLGLITELRVFVREAKTMDNLLKSKEFGKIAGELSSIDYILKYYR